MSREVTCGRGKDFSEFKKDQIIGQHQGLKSGKEISEITGVGLRTVQRIIKSWKDLEEETSSGKMRDRKTILNNRDRRSLKRLLKYNRNKTILQLTKSFDTASLRKLHDLVQSMTKRMQAVIRAKGEPTKY